MIMLDIDLEALRMPARDHSSEIRIECQVDLKELVREKIRKLRNRLNENANDYDHPLPGPSAEDPKEYQAPNQTSRKKRSCDEILGIEKSNGSNERNNVDEAYQDDRSDCSDTRNSRSLNEQRREESSQQQRGYSNSNPEATSYSVMPNYVTHPIQYAPDIPNQMPYDPQMSIPTQIPTSPQIQPPSEIRLSQKSERDSLSDFDAIARQEIFKTPKLPELDFHDRLAAAGIKNLYQRSPPDEPLSYNITLNTLQRMVLHELQGQLVGTVREIVHRQELQPDLMENARTLLEKYSMSILDTHNDQDSF